MQLSQNILKKEKVKFEEIRFIDKDIAVGVYPDMTDHGYEKDEWPSIQKQIMDTDILIVGSPIWLGQESSETKKLIERLYGMSGETNDKGQFIYYGKVGGCMITGNDDGAKHCSMGILYSLQHVGFSIPPQADCGWLGEIGPGPSYGDTEWKDKKINLPEGFDSDFTNRNVTFMTYNLLHLAKMMKENGGYGNSVEKWNDGTQWSFENPE